MDSKVDAKFDSIRNDEVIVIEKYKFCKSYILKDDTVRFRCANKKCGSSVLVSPNRSNIIKFNNTSHNHPVSTTKTLALLNQPHTVEEAYKQLYDIQENITSNDEQFCFVNQEKNMIIITCSTNLKFLCDSEYVFGDGTFFTPQNILFNSIHFTCTSKSFMYPSHFVSYHLKLLNNMN